MPIDELIELLRKVREAEGNILVGIKVAGGVVMEETTEVPSLRIVDHTRNWDDSVDTGRILLIH